MIERLLTPADVAELCQISTKTVLRSMHAGRLKASRLGEQGAFRMRAEDVARWIELGVVADRRPTGPVEVPRLPAQAADFGRLVLAPEMGRGRAS
jgi:excisionase family DNA binding protein